MSSSVPEVRALVKVLTKIVERSADDFPGFDDLHQLSGALGGLCCMEEKHVEVRGLVTALAKLVGPTTTTAPRAWKSGQNHNAVKADRIGTALFGLQVR